MDIRKTAEAVRELALEGMYDNDRIITLANWILTELKDLGEMYVSVESKISKEIADSCHADELIDDPESVELLDGMYYRKGLRRGLQIIEEVMMDES